MEAIDIIIKIGAAATATTAIGAFIWALVRVFKAIYKFLHGMEQNVKVLLEHDKEQYLAILRLTITADHIPISERLIAGEKYVSLGGNGEIKQLYNELKRQCEEAIGE